jgi:hypothetical protein
MHDDYFLLERDPGARAARNLDFSRRVLFFCDFDTDR